MAKHKAASWKARTARGGDTARQSEAARRKRIIDTTTEADVLGDLRLSPLEYRDPRELKPSPYNETFEPLKDDAYWTNLRRDIEEAGAITDPLLIFPDGEIASGHSRRRIALDLLNEGRREFEKIPVRVILSELSEPEKRKRVYLGNLSRFEIDTNTRLRLYAEIYPEYFGKERKAGEKTETVSVSTIASDLGVTERQVRNERAIYQKAKKRATTRGKTAPEAEDLAAARKEKNRGRRKPQTETVSVSAASSNQEAGTKPELPAATKTRPGSDHLQEQIEAAFLTAVKKASASDNPPAFLDGIASVAQELEGTVSMRKTLDLIQEHRRDHGGR